MLQTNAFVFAQRGKSNVRATERQQADLLAGLAKRSSGNGLIHAQLQSQVANCHEPAIGPYLFTPELGRALVTDAQNYSGSTAPSSASASSRSWSTQTM